MRRPQVSSGLGDCLTERLPLVDDDGPDVFAQPVVRRPIRYFHRHDQFYTYGSRRYLRELHQQWDVDRNGYDDRRSSHCHNLASEGGNPHNQGYVWRKCDIQGKQRLGSAGGKQISDYDYPSLQPESLLLQAIYYMDRHRDIKRTCSTHRGRQVRYAWVWQID